MTHARPVALTRTPVGRWALWVLLAMVLMTQAVTCQAVVGTPAVPSAAVACENGIGHDTVCPPRIAPAAAPATRNGGGKDDPVRAGLGLIVAFALVGWAVAVGFRTTGPPPWAPRQLVRSRDRLAAIGITRI